MAEGKPEAAATPQGTKPAAKTDLNRVGKEMAQRARRVGQSAASRVTQAGKTAQEVGARVQKQVKQVRKQLAPAAAKAKVGLKQAQKGLGKALQVTARATRKSARIIGLKAQIVTAVRKRQKLFGQMGETYYKLLRRKGAVPSQDKTLAELVKEAEAVNREIRQLQAREKIERTAP